MSLYLPDAFRAPDEAALTALLQAYPFATLITTVQGETFISHLPLLLVAPGVLCGHLAAANLHARALMQAPSVAVFVGPHTYVSPGAYVEPQTAVPTWNYAAVHAHGQARVLDDVAKLAAVDELSARFEHDRAQPWQRGLEGAALQAKLRAIVAFDIPVQRFEAKFKMSQNRSTADRRGVIADLRTRGGSGDVAVAEWMQAHADV
jgi:transcriptional regulator